MTRRRISQQVSQVGRHALVPFDPDAKLHRLNQEYGEGYLAGLFGTEDGRSHHHYSEYYQGVRDAQVARVLCDGE